MITIDGRELAAHGTLLDACRAAGAHVPALCHDDRLSTGGHCRACMVEVDGAHVPACCTPAREGAVVRTDTPELRAYRQDLGELMLAECSPAGHALEAVSRWGAEGARYPRRPRSLVRDHTHDHVRLDLDRCILCRRCVRACEEIEGLFVLAVEGRGARARIGWGGGAFDASPCVACGACVSVCPSEALTSRDAAPHFRDLHVARTTCGACSLGCQLDVHVTGGADDRVSHVEPADAAPNHGHACARGRFAHGSIVAADRLVHPLVRRGGALERATWDEALAAAARGLLAHLGAAAALTGGACTNEEAYLLQKFARGVLRTNDVGGSRLAAVRAARDGRAGRPADAPTLEALERADALLTVHADATHTHPVAGAAIRRRALAGVPLVVLDPRPTELAELADVHLSPRPGMEAAVLEALDLAIAEARGAAADARASRHAPERIADDAGVSAERVRDAARLLAAAARPWVAVGEGASRELGSLAPDVAARLARHDAQPCVLAGQGNEFGALAMGCAPDRLPGAALDDPGARERIERAWGRALPEHAGRAWPELRRAIVRGEVRALLVLGDEPALEADPRGLDAIECLIVCERRLSPLAARAHVVLPVAELFENDGTLGSLEGRSGVVHAALDPPGEARREHDVLLALFAACGWPQSADGAAVSDEIARVGPEGSGLPAVAG